MKKIIWKKCHYVWRDINRYSNDTIVLYEGTVIWFDKNFKCEMVDCNIKADKKPFYFECLKWLKIDWVRATNILQKI